QRSLRLRTTRPGELSALSLLLLRSRYAEKKCEEVKQISVEQFRWSKIRRPARLESYARSLQFLQERIQDLLYVRRERSQRIVQHIADAKAFQICRSWRGKLPAPGFRVERLRTPEHVQRGSQIRRAARHRPCHGQKS